MMIDRRGKRLDDIVLTEYVDPLWRGQAADGREVLVAIRTMKYTQERDDLWRYEVPGLARVAYFGVCEPGEVALAEERPAGVQLSTLRVSERDAIAIGIALCTTTIAWSERREDLHIGIRPETVWVEGGRFTGATPRTECLIRESDQFEPPSGIGTCTADDVGFLIARTLWIAIHGEDPYRFAGSLNANENMWSDRRRPWPGTPALGGVLDRVLRTDDRMSVRDFRIALQGL